MSVAATAAEFLDTSRPERPYPGLRPFESREWSIFFGRERMIDEVIDRLAAQTLVLIHGPSGTGKSSLVRAGVLPKLARQHLRYGLAWLPCSIRPSGGPLWNLAAEFAALEGRAGDLERIPEITIHFSKENTTLGLVAGALSGIAGRRICILVDQFEELFRFARETSREEAELFVRLLTQQMEVGSGSDRAANDGGRDGAYQSAAEVHVVITMRSEFLGECTRFSGLAEAINRTQYLVPRMGREALFRAICRPAQLYGGEVTTALARRLIEETEARDDELPLIQHGLMLMWQQAQKLDSEMHRDRIVLDAETLRAKGGLINLLSEHADSILDEVAVDDLRRKAVERMFRALTDINAEGRGIRRPQLFRDLVAISGVDTQTLRSIVDAFRAEGVSFLTPYGRAVQAHEIGESSHAKAASNINPLINANTASIQDSAVIDISHEALIRCWRRIVDPVSGAGWLKQEFDDGLQWRMLLLQAKAKPFHLIPAPGIYEREQWFVQQSERWSERYGGEWTLVRHLIDASLQAAAQEREKAEQMTAELQRRLHETDGLVHRGDVAAALTNYAHALELARRLVEFDPSNPSRQREVAEVAENAGNLHASAGQLPEALSCYRESLYTIEQLSNVESENVDLRSKLAGLHSKIGDVLLARGGPVE